MITPVCRCVERLMWDWAGWGGWGGECAVSYNNLYHLSATHLVRGWGTIGSGAVGFWMVGDAGTSWVTASVGVCFSGVSFLDCVVGRRPGTSLGSPTSVMTEHQRLANTSCGSPGSMMCHQQHRLAGAGRLLGVCVCVFPVPGVLAGLMPFPESQGQAARTLSPSDSLCADP